MKLVSICVTLFIASLACDAMDQQMGGHAAPQLLDIKQDSAIPFLKNNLKNVMKLANKKNPAGLVQIVRILTLVMNSWFDVWATYHGSSNGVAAKLARQPEAERTTENMNNAFFYATLRVTEGLMHPYYNGEIRNMMSQLGLDTSLMQEDESTPVGIGNKIGNIIVQEHYRDGMNQLGDECGRTYNRRNYSDCTGYMPVNSADRLVDPTRWQPAIRFMKPATYMDQRFMTPQCGSSKPYFIQDINAHEVKPPGRFDKDQYELDVADVLSVSAGLTDEQKALAEIFSFENRPLLSSLEHFLVYHNMTTLDEMIPLQFLAAVAIYDGIIFSWKEKMKYDSARPFTAIAHMHGNNTVKALGGPGAGTVDDIKGTEWTSYLPVPGDPEYPSSMQVACSVEAEAMRVWTGKDELNWTIEVPQGSSKIEPGITPQEKLTITIKTWTEFEDMCGLSKIYAGVHFRDSVVNVKEVSQKIGRDAVDFVKAHIE